MPPRNWIRLAFLLAILTSCARSSSIIEDEPFDDDDAGFTGIGDDGGSDPNGDGSAGDGGSQQDGGSGGGTNSDGGPGLDGGPDGDAPHPCEGVTCNSPPANTCADAQKLRVYPSASATTTATAFTSRPKSIAPTVVRTASARIARSMAIAAPAGTATPVSARAATSICTAGRAARTAQYRTGFAMRAHASSA